MGTSGTVTAQGPSASGAKAAKVWATAGVSSVGTLWAGPYIQGGRDTCLDRMAIFSVVLLCGAAESVEAPPSAMATTPETGNVAPRSRPGAVPPA